MTIRRELLDAIGYPPGTGWPLWLINTLVQRVLRHDAACRYSKHFTSRVLHPKGLVIEDDCPVVRTCLSVSGGCYLQAADGLFIGRGTIFASNVALVSQDHDMEDFTRAPISASIRIGRQCWIGFGAVVLPGITLGDRTIVGANSVVRHSFPEGNVVIAGAPAIIVRKR